MLIYKFVHYKTSQILIFCDILRYFAEPCATESLFGLLYQGLKVFTAYVAFGFPIERNFAEIPF